MSYSKIVHTLKKLGNPEKAVFLRRFFKTAKGQYAEGDQFLGITVPVQRTVAKKYSNLDRDSLNLLLANGIHEYRLTALVILVDQFKHGDARTKKDIFTYYLSKTKRINNWDLVDLSARDIIGEYIVQHPTEAKVLYRLVKSKNIWERRIAIISTWALIRKNQFEHTLALSTILLKDTHDLMHKAVGWMLREVGKRDRQILVEFLNSHAHEMPRTALRYSIEHFSQKERTHYMNMRSRA